MATSCPFVNVNTSFLAVIIDYTSFISLTSVSNSVIRSR